MSDSENTPEEEPKIIVDSDWKEQVAKEKEAAEEVSEPAESSPVADASGDQPQAPPPASFEVLVTMLFTQGMSMLGQIPDPSAGEIQINKPFAKHFIDTMEMLGEKTAGNLTDNESKMLSEALHALRMAYVSVKE